MIDVWWTAFGENFPDWGIYTNHGKLKTKDAYNEVVNITKGFKSKSIIHVGNDLEILETFPDNYFDWVYIDSTHQFEQTLKELHIADKKVKPNGIICGHDYEPDPSHQHHGVFRAVQEFVRSTSWEISHLDNHIQWALKKK